MSHIVKLKQLLFADPGEQELEDQAPELQRRSALLQGRACVLRTCHITYREAEVSLIADPVEKESAKVKYLNPSSGFQCHRSNLVSCTWSHHIWQTGQFTSWLHNVYKQCSHCLQILGNKS